MIAGEEEFTFSSPLRHALVESQWEDLALRPLMETLHADRKALLGPNSRVHLRLVADYGLEGLVAQSNGESSWVIIVPDGEYRPGGSWKSFF